MWSQPKPNTQLHHTASIAELSSGTEHDTSLQYESAINFIPHMVHNVCLMVHHLNSTATTIATNTEYGRFHQSIEKNEQHLLPTFSEMP